MTAFIPRKLALEETAGEKLRQARHYRKLKIEDVARRLNIRPEYLMALEEERFDILPAGLYGKNFLKEYARFLKLNPQELLASLNQAGDGQLDDPFSQKIVKKRKFIIFPKIIRNAAIIAAVLICFLYLTFYFKKIISPPLLEISSPEKNMLISAPAIAVSGLTEAEAEVRINGQIVLNNNNGQFSQNVDLKSGLNSIIITAKKKYSQEQTVIRQILVK